MDYDITLDESSLESAVEGIKTARAKMLRNYGPCAYIYLHRKMEVEHTDERCICDPVFIRQDDVRPSLYFAEQILNPVLH